MARQKTAGFRCRKTHRRRSGSFFETLETRRLLTTFEIIAAGSEGTEQVELLIDGAPTATWTNVGGDVDTDQFVSLSHTTTGTIDPSRVRVAFTNDLYEPSQNIDRNVRIDAIVIDGQRYETESPDTFSTGTWVEGIGVEPGFPESEYLHSNGYFQFVSAASGSFIQIRTRGDEGSEEFDLKIDGVTVQSYSTTTEFALYGYQASETISPSRISVAFTNDLYDEAASIDRNLQVDYVSIDGFRSQTEDPSVLSTGTWVNDGAIPGFWESETLHVEGEFQYAGELPTGGSEISFVAYGETGNENMELLINGVEVADWESIGTTPQTFTYVASETLTPEQVRVRFSNDQFDELTQADWNLFVDYLILDGVKIETESPQVYSTGTYNDAGLIPGFRQDETLHANGYFQYAADPGVVSLASSVINVAEGDSFAELTIQRTRGFDGIVTLDFATVGLSATPGDDFTPQTGTVTFSEGEAIKTIQVPLIDDALIESNEQFSFTIDNPTGGVTLLVPRTATITIDDNDSVKSTGDGLRAEYFDQRLFLDRFAQRIDSTVNFDWGMSAPIAGMGVDSFSVRWTGQIEPRYSETYTFTTVSDDGVRLWVDDQLIIDEWNDHPATSHTGTISLLAGVLYDIRMEHYDNAADATASLSWQSLSQPFEIVPQSQLYAADPVPPPPGDNLTSESVVTGLIQPTSIDFSPDGTNLYVAEQRGIVRVMRNGQLQTSPVLDFTDRVNGTRDRGLLDIAIHPDLTNNPYIYLLYTYDPPEANQQSPGSLAGPDGNGNRAGRMTRVTLSAATNYTTIVPNSEVVLVGTTSVWSNFNGAANSTFDFDEPPAGILPDGSNLQDFIATDSESHTVGSIEFGTDGSLFVSIGDGTSYNRVDPRTYRVQDIDNLSGKILRIDPITGEGLSTNPFYNGDAGANRSKVYQYGLRNPFRISVDPVDGDLFVGDVGWTQWEEINSAAPGANFGWPHYEGGNGESLQTEGYEDLAESTAFYASNPTVEPSILGLNHAADGINAIVLGAVYNGDAYPAEYQGDLFFNDLGQGIVRNVSFDAEGNVQKTDTFTTGANIVVQIVQGPDGLLYYVDLDDGEVGRWVFTDTAAAAGASALASDQQVPVLNAQQINSQLTLSTHSSGDTFTNSGGWNEEWFVDADDQWYFITPTGDVYRWNEGSLAESTWIAKIDTPVHDLAQPSMAFIVDEALASLDAETNELDEFN